MATSLPTLQPIQRLSPRVIRILGGNPSKFTLQGTNTYLIGTGPQRLLLDTAQGLPTYPPLLSSLLLSESCTISHVFLTHWHPDHVLGVPSLLSLLSSPPFTTTTVSIHKHTPRCPPETSHHESPISDNQTWAVEGATLRAVYCPGHTDDHVAFVLEEEGAMFTGDNVLGHGTAVFEDLGVYLRSLEVMRGRFSGRAYPGHGDVIEDGPGKVAEYIAHRRRREEEVLGVLREQGGGQGKTPREVVKVVYKDVPESLHLPAEGGVAQVLEKLEGEGKVGRREGGRWIVAGKAAL